MNIRRILLEEFRVQAARPFVWGQTDCLRTACAFAKRITGYDPGFDFLHEYHSELGARRFLLRKGCRTVGDLAALVLPEIPPSMAQSGDWAYVVQDGQDGLGVVVSWQIALRHVEGGMGFLPLSFAKRAFRVLE